MLCLISYYDFSFDSCNLACNIQDYILHCSSKMRDIGEKQFSIVASGDTKPNSWTLLDFG
jgi:hypothetical protein